MAEQIEAALRPSERERQNSGSSGFNSECLEGQICSALLGSMMLPRLRHLQSSFAPITISQLVPRLPATLPPQPNLTTWTKLVTSHSATPLTPESPVNDLLLGHSLSATFKDCSIFLRSNLGPASASTGADIKAIDLDPKPLSKVYKWAELEREVDAGWERDSRAWREAGWDVRECCE